MDPLYRPVWETKTSASQTGLGEPKFFICSQTSLGSRNFLFIARPVWEAEIFLLCPDQSGMREVIFSAGDTKSTAPVDISMYYVPITFQRYTGVAYLHVYICVEEPVLPTLA